MCELGPLMEPQKPVLRRDRGALAGGVVGVAIVLAAVVLASAMIIASPPSVPAPDGAEVSAADQASPPTETAETQSAAADGEQASCAPRTLEAPIAGRWTLYRAEFGSRSGHDYLRLKLRRVGNADAAARVGAELVPPAEVPARSGLETPSGADVALLVRFDGPVSIPGRFGGRGGGSLGEFYIARGSGDATYVVAAVNGRGCFRLSGGSWESGDAADNVEIVLEIERS